MLSCTDDAKNDDFGASPIKPDECVLYIDTDGSVEEDNPMGSKVVTVFLASPCCLNVELSVKNPSCFPNFCKSINCTTWPVGNNIGEIIPRIVRSFIKFI